MIIGDTPAQLGKIEAADATMIDGKIVTRDDYRALAAQVEALRKALEYADNKLYILTHNRKDVSERLLGDADKAFKVVRDTLSQTASTQHHLRQVRADAVAKFVEWAADTQPNIDCMLDDSTDYIASILAGKE